MPTDPILNSHRIEQLLGVYRDGLFDDTLPFWFPRCVDEQYGGFLVARNRDGSLLDDDKYARWHQMVHDWAHTHFPDSQYGEWYGYLHRDGRVSVPLKGNLWKGPFHLPRMQLICWKMLAKS
jgi:N-acylglucosamine 2-epimerase